MVLCWFHSVLPLVVYSAESGCLLTCFLFFFLMIAGLLNASSFFVVFFLFY